MERRSSYQTTAALKTTPPSQTEHPLRSLLGERAEAILATGGKWRVLLHVAGGVVRKAEVTELDIEVAETT